MAGLGPSKTHDAARLEAVSEPPTSGLGSSVNHEAPANNDARPGTQDDPVLYADNYDLSPEERRRKAEELRNQPPNEGRGALPPSLTSGTTMVEDQEETRSIQSSVGSEPDDPEFRNWKDVTPGEDLDGFGLNLLDFYLGTGVLPYS